VLRISSLEQEVKEGENPVVGEVTAVRGPSKSRVVWDCSPKWKINFFYTLIFMGNRYRTSMAKARGKEINEDGLSNCE